MSKLKGYMSADLPKESFNFVKDVRNKISTDWDDFILLSAIILEDTDPKLIEEAKRKIENGVWNK